MLIVGVDKTYAAFAGIGDKPAGSKYCYYMSPDKTFKASLKLMWGYEDPRWHTLKSFADVSVDKVGDRNYMMDAESVLNWWRNGRSSCIKNGTVCFENTYYKNSAAANQDNNPICPKYLIFEDYRQYKVWGTESLQIAQNAVKEISKFKDAKGYYATYCNSAVSSGCVPYTSEEYYAEFAAEGIVKFDPNGKISCEEFERLLGEPNDAGNKETGEPPSIRYIIDQILGYVRIIVPILIILLGSLDFAKAVVASKADNMKKAQTDFIKRLIIGVAVFFVPVLVDIIMELAEIVWAGQYDICNLNL